MKSSWDGRCQSEIPAKHINFMTRITIVKDRGGRWYHIFMLIYLGTKNVDVSCTLGCLFLCVCVCVLLLLTVAVAVAVKAQEQDLS